MQPALNILANRPYRINKTTVKKLLKQASDKQKHDAVSTDSADFWRQPTVVDWIQKAAVFIQHYLSVHALHKAITTATDDELKRAQDDFGAIVRCLRLLPMGDLDNTEGWQQQKYHVLTRMGRFAVAGSLALRHSGYGTYVDQAVEWLDDWS